jgi:hypothetical protein
MELVISPQGDAQCVYSEAISLHSIGNVQIQRASHVEPDGQGQWWADLSPVSGPKLGPFQQRSAALEAETSWLREHWLTHR